MNDHEFVAVVRTGNKSGAGFHGGCVSREKEGEMVMEMVKEEFVLYEWNQVEGGIGIFGVT